ncbi:MAG TPA: PQQ-dependent sugar dehydrogenase [Thermodesulfovibrionales bacterium]|nr:PQQ-dependent sugar dehydrogenase [Thermodesulfovibrionales bacterium]
MKKIFFVIMLVHLLSPVASCTQVVGREPQNVKDIFLREGDRVNVQVWVQGLDIPWSLIFLPDGSALVSERPGRIRVIRDGKLQDKAYAELEVAHVGEGGLMGLAVHPAFPKEPFVYAMHTYRRGDDLYNRVVRLRDEGTKGSIDRVIIDGIPGGRVHDGGRIAFGPDGMLYITAGETSHSELAQDMTSLGGKILRVTPEGDIPEGNPFKGSAVYSCGNRNPQGLAWQPGTGKLFESEHGPSGEFGHFGHDEINVIVKGGNYGWPKVIGAPSLKLYIDPTIVWKSTTPPSGMTFYRGALLNHLKGDLFVATLKSECLVRVQFDGKGEVRRIEKWFSDGKKGKFGRLRDVVEGPEGALYFLTNNRDGRGSPGSGDDRIYRITPK